MSRFSTSWYSERLNKEVKVVRWGEYGRPVLFLPTAAADAEEVERFHIVESVRSLLEEGRIKLYSVDSVAGHFWLTEDNATGPATRMQNQFDSFLYHELVPAIRRDCNSADAQIIATGPSIGAFNALAVLLRHPDAFSTAICMSGTYDLNKFLKGEMTDDYFHSSPLHFVPHIQDEGWLQILRERFVLIAHGRGRWEDPEESWRVADTLGAKGIPNRVDEWGEEYDHDWPTWREMLPNYLNELL
jgi:esterase/lipase superfamily enzyme